MYYIVETAGLSLKSKALTGLYRPRIAIPVPRKARQRSATVRLEDLIYGYVFWPVELPMPTSVSGRILRTRMNHNPYTITEREIDIMRKISEEPHHEGLRDLYDEDLISSLPPAHSVPLPIGSSVYLTAELFGGAKAMVVSIHDNHVCIRIHDTTMDIRVPRAQVRPA
tara:strand:+ start:489 stop:992 length:504 start_codon:yes stop_codon:yes gene_type:complete